MTPRPLQIGFAGTPPFAAAALEAILAAGFPVALVLSQPDRPRGRGLEARPGAVKAVALAHGLPLRQPASLKPESQWGPIIPTALDVLVVAAYGLILPPALLSWPTHGCLNIHASLLPRWRGAAPIARAILAGDAMTGISIMRIDEGLDTGPVVSRHPLKIAPGETSGTLHDKLAVLGARAIVETLQALERGESLAVVTQDPTAATYAPKVEPAEALVDWDAQAVEIERAVRAFDPTPGARTSYHGAQIKLWRTDALSGAFGAPGTVIRADASGIIVACGVGALVISELQRAGGRRMNAGPFLAGHPMRLGARFGAADG